MKYLNYILPIFIAFLLFSCAKQSAPMGGQKDEDKPVLLSITPTNESINTKPSSIILEFDEYVRTETPNKLILVTPRINKDEIEVIANRNKVTVSLNQELEDSTTYVFNFQKSIKDITEGNVPDNLRLVFSTGNTIDSLTAAGQVSFNFPQNDEKIENVLIGFYTLEDTTNVFTGPPYYVAQADSTGKFILENLKAGMYFAFAWQDANGNNKAEEKTEPHAFIKDTINLQEDITGINFILNKSDVSNFKILRSATFGENYDISTSKSPVDISVTHENIGKELFYALREKSIRFYHTRMRDDSISVNLQLKDSVGYAVDTTMFLKFPTSDRKKETPTASVQPAKTFLKNIEAQITFNKPIKDVNYDSLFVKYDTASVIPITRQMLYFKDSLQLTTLNLSIPIADSLPGNTFTMYVGDSTFMDIEGLWTEKKTETSFSRINRETLSEEVKVTVNTKETPLLIQILSTKDEVIREAYLTNSNSASFKDMEAGTYVIRAIVDINGNKRWDTSNFYQQRYAEPIYFLKNPESKEPYNTIIRGGWTLDVTIEPREPNGFTPTKPKIQ